jgi:hypothetical protein
MSRQGQRWKSKPESRGIREEILEFRIAVWELNDDLLWKIGPLAKGEMLYHLLNRWGRVARGRWIGSRSMELLGTSDLKERRTGVAGE